MLEAAGVQILTQDLWETLVSFVISQNNNIPRIKKLVAALCKQFGERRQLAGHEFYTFPTWERLAAGCLRVRIPYCGSIFCQKVCGPS